MIDSMHGALKRHASAYSRCGSATAFASIVLDSAGHRPAAVNHLITARVKTERKVRVVYQTVDEPARRCGPRELILR